MKNINILDLKKWRLIVFCLLVAITCYFIYLLSSLLPVFIFAGLLAYLLNPIVLWLMNHNVKRSIAIFIIYFSVFFTLSITIILGFPKVIIELNELAEMIPFYTEQVREYMQQIQNNYQRIDLPESIRQVIEEIINKIEMWILNLTTQFADGIIDTFSKIIYLLITPILAFYILKDWENLEKRILRAMPIPVRTHISKLGEEINIILKKFIRGHLIVASIVGMLSAIGFSILGVEFALTLGIIAGIADLIPYFGPVIGMIPAVMVGLLQSSNLAIKIMILMILIQQIESNIISPKILGDSVGLHPLSIIFVVLAGGHLFGLLGMVLAVPTVAIIRTIVIYLFEHLLD